MLALLARAVILFTFLNRSRIPRCTTPGCPPATIRSAPAAAPSTTRCRSSGWPVGRWREPFGRLAATGTGNELIITRSDAGRRVPFSREEATLLANWVEARQHASCCSGRSAIGTTRATCLAASVSSRLPPSLRWVNLFGFLGPSHRDGSVAAQPGSGQLDHRCSFPHGSRLLPARPSPRPVAGWHGASTLDRVSGRSWPRSSASPRPRCSIANFLERRGNASHRPRSPRARRPRAYPSFL